MVFRLVLEIKSRAKALNLFSSTNLNTTTGSNYYLVIVGLLILRETLTKTHSLMLVVSSVVVCLEAANIKEFYC